MSFRHVIAGTDGSGEASDGVKQGLRLTAEDGEMLVLSIAETHLAARTGMSAPEWDQQLRAEAEAARQAAEDLLAGDGRVRTQVVTGRAGQEMVAWARRTEADLIAVGSRGNGRVAGVMFGSVATLVVHDAHCSVLVARPSDGDAWPTAVTVGVDGSEHARRAETVAREIAGEHGATVRVVTADERSPVGELVSAGAESDLLVVGSRGLSGLRAIGSVAERVAHQAPCSVLIVR